MLTKAATHLRPFLRASGPAAPSPEHFTANPSLLHHLPQNGIGSSLAAQSHGSASTAGGSAGAGRAGYSSAGAGGGGYTGHARSFLSIPQKSSADQSSSLLNSDEQQTSARPASYAQQYALQQRLIGPSPRTIRSVAADLKIRAGSQVGILELENGGGWENGKKLVAGRRRGSITAQISFTPRSVVRTTAELWRVGIKPKGNFRQPSANLSTSATKTILLPERDNSTHYLIRNPTARRNSTSAIPSRPSVPPPDLDHLQDPSDPDLKIWNALASARQYGNRELAQKLIAHYRSSREYSPFADSVSLGNPELSSQFPLPAGYTIATYNACLIALVDTRRPGESIAPILEIYNEMLERDIVPNSKTYAHVIKALTLREKDVASAVKLSKEQIKWEKWSAEKLGTPQGIDTEGDRNAIVEAYLSEGNLESALKLFRISTMVHHWDLRTQTTLYSQLLSACAVSPNVTASAITEVINHAKSQSSVPLSLYKSMFSSLAALGDSVGLRKLWEEFEIAAVSEEGLTAEGWYPTTNGSTIDPISPSLLDRFRRETCQVAIQSLVQVNENSLALSIASKMFQKSHTASTFNFPPSGNMQTLGAVVSSLAEKGDFESAREWYNKTLDVENPISGKLSLVDMYSYVDKLLLAGQLFPATKVYLDIIESQGSHNIDQVRLRRIVTALLSATKSSSDPSSLLDLLSSISSSPASHLDTTLASHHLSILLAASRFEEMPAVLDSYRPRSAVSDSHLASSFSTISQSDIPLQALLPIIRAFVRQRQPVDSQIAEATIAKYQTARSLTASPIELELSPDSWFRLVGCFTKISRNRMESGELDSAMVLLAEDLGAIRNSQIDLLASFISSSVITRLIDAYSFRFGESRALQMLAPIQSSTPTSRMTESDVSLPSSSTQLRLSAPLSSRVDTHAVYNASITAQQSYSDIRKSLAMNEVPYPEAIGRLMVSLARENDESKVRELYDLGQLVLNSCVLDEEKKINSWASLEDSMLIACCLLGHLEQAGVHRARIIEGGRAPSADAYASMISNAKDTTDDALVARQLFDESQSLGVRPHLYLYNTIISKLSKARKAELALELFMNMKHAGIKPSSVTYGAIINACCRVGDAESATTLFEEMSNMPNFKPRVPPFNTMMQFHLQTKPSRERVLHYYTQLKAARVPPSAHTYKLLLDAYSLLPPIDLQSMERVFEELAANKRVPVQATHHASMITGYAKAGRLDRSLEIFESINEGIEPVVWEAMLTVLGEAGDVEQLDAMVERMSASGSRSTAYVCNVLIAAYAKAGLIDKSRQVFENMVDCASGWAAPNNHLQLLTSSGHVKPATTTATPTDDIYREPSTYEAMIKAEIGAGEVERATECLNRMEKRNYPVAVYMKARSLLE